ncbi:unnamed protein product [Calicophoron daubneyi]|uniref:ADP-ribosylhydrolase ARH3 n=1 Tax=Calicophoron daubneyi TaxID=300641 RepID=A0AAV2TMA1_CALDB
MQFHSILFLTVSAMNIDDFCRGVVFGGLIGDCYGYLYEDKDPVEYDVITKLVNDSISGELIYTDDTQMALAVLRSLRAGNKLVPEDLAREFAHDYFTDGRHRYYGGTVPLLFEQMQSTRFHNPYKYAANLFGGTGSFGNGGAMRVSPAAIYGLNFDDLEFERLIVDITRLTHTHPLAIYGALLQAFAVKQVWEIVSTPDTCLDPNSFLDQLLDRLTRTQYKFINFNATHWHKAYDEYVGKFSHIKSLLASDDCTAEEVRTKLGTSLEAIQSVPCALYAFLRSLKPIKQIPFSSIPLRCLVYVIGLGGDTDSIGTMACSLAGGFVGVGADQSDPQCPIPDKLLSRCERLRIVKQHIGWLISRFRS